MEKKIGVTTATVVGINAMIGAGILAAPADISRLAGPAGVLSFLLVVPAILCIALSLARLAHLFPDQGSFYSYARSWGGHGIGLLAYGSYILGLIMGMGLLSRMAAVYLVDLVTHVSGTAAYTNTYLYGLGIIAATAFFNLLGVTVSAIGQQILFSCTLFPLIVTSIICTFNANLAHLTPFAPHGIHGVLSTVRIATFGFFGFECAVALLHVMRDPKRTLPRALALSLITVCLVYVGFITSLMLAFPAAQLQSDTLLPELLATLLSPNSFIPLVVQFSALFAIIGTIHSMIWSSGTLLHNFLGMQLTSAPSRTQCIVGISAAIYASFLFIHNDGLFFSMTTACIIVCHLLCMMGLLCRRSEWREGNNVRTIMGMLAAATILYFSLEGIINTVNASV